MADREIVILIPFILSFLLYLSGDHGLDCGGMNKAGTRAAILSSLIVVGRYKNRE